MADSQADHVRMSLRRLLCLLAGGHDLGLPQVKDGRYRLVCQYGCGFMSEGIETKGMEQQRQRVETRSKVKGHLRLLQDRVRRGRVA